jgi:hypothetical protein
MRRLLPAAALALALALSSSGCAPAVNEGVVINGARVADAVIDRDPLALLPGGVIALGYLDAPALLRSPIGPDVAKLVQSLLPLGPESGFDAARDVTSIWGGAYSMQGADFCAVVQGTFDPDAIRRAAEVGAVTAIGAPLVKSSYAGNDLYTAGNIGFVVVTPHVVLAGNETGIRRALDRLRGSQLERAVPAWMVDIAGTKNAAMAGAADLSEQTPPGPLASALGGVRHVRVLGNFDPPGLNLAGALTYTDAEGAAHAVSFMHSMTGALMLAGAATALGGIPMPKIHTEAQASDLAFTAAFDASALRPLLNLVASFSRKPASPASPTSGAPAGPAAPAH